MPDLVNTRDHAVRVRDENGKLVRVVPGQVVSAEGSTADQLSGVEGIESASDDDREAWEASRAGVSDAQSSKTALEDQYSRLRTQGARRRSPCR